MNCKVCATSTGSNRPYCSAHIDHSPYVRLLNQYVKDRFNETKVSNGAINLNGTLSCEVLESVSNYPKTQCDIASSLDIDDVTTGRYIQALGKAGYIAQDWALLDKFGNRSLLIRITSHGKDHFTALARLA